MAKLRAWGTRMRLQRHLVEARNSAVALGLDGTAADIRLIIYALIRKWDDELQAERENGK